MSQVVTELVIDADTSGADRFSQSMDKASGSAQQGINSAAGLTLAIAGVGVAFIGALAGLRSFFDYVGQQNKQLIDIAENARNAGMTAREFQETLFAARSKGLTEKDFVSGLDKIATDLTEASAGVTKFGRLFEANGISIKNVNGELKNSKQALADIAGLMQGATPVIQQGIAKIVGLSKEWIPFLREGAEAIEKQKKMASDLGIIIGDDVIEKAKVFDAQWKTAIATWDLQFKASLADILPLLVKMANLASTILEGVGGVSSSVSRWMTPDDEKSKAQLKDQISDVARLRDMMELLAQTGGEFKKLRVTNLAELVGLGGDATLKEVDALLTKLHALYDKKPTAITVGAVGSTVLPANDNRDLVDRAITALLRHTEAQKADAASMGLGARAHAELRAEAALTAAIQANGGKITQEQANAFIWLKLAAGGAADALERAKVATQIKFGRDTAFLSQADVQIASQLKGIYPDVATALGSVEAQALRSNNQLRQMNDLARSSATSFSNDLISGLGQGQEAVEALHNAFKNLASTLTSSALKSLFEGDFVSAGIKGIAAITAAIFSANTSSSGEKWLAKQKEEMANRQADYASRVTLAGVDTNTRAGAILAQDQQFIRERIAENKAGGQAMNTLLQAQVDERNALLRDWDKRETDLVKSNADAKLAIEKAAADRSLGFQNRLFAATNNFDTLQGQLAAFDRAALQERAREVEAGGQALVDLEAAQAAERYNVIKSYNDKLLESLNAAAKPTVDYLNNLVSGPGSTSSPAATLASAQTIYQSNLALAQAGNADAQAKFASVADNLEKAARLNFASGQGYQDIKSMIIANGLGLPAVQATTDPVTKAVRDAITAIQAGNVALGTANTLTGSVISNTSLTSARLLETNQNTVDAANATGANNQLLTQNNNKTDAGNATLSAIQGLQATSSANLALMQTALSPGAI